MNSARDGEKKQIEKEKEREKEREGETRIEKKFWGLLYESFGRKPG